MTTPPLTSMSRPRRLDKYLKDSLGWTRQETHLGLESVRLNGGPAKPSDMVFPGDEVEVDGVSVCGEPRLYRSILFHKPLGVITAHSDPHGRRCLDEFSQDWGDACAVGRLDKETSGLLLVTDDGDLSFALLHPDFHVDKTYVLEVAQDIEADDKRLEMWRQGVEIGDGLARAKRVVQTGVRFLEMVIDEGRNRQIRRMCKVVRMPLLALHRRAFGSLELDVEEGQWRELSSAEVEQLWEDAGGKDRVLGRQFDALHSRAALWRARGRPDRRLEAWLEEMSS